MAADSPVQAQERHDRFIRSTGSNRAVWVLRSDVGLATWSDEETDTLIVPLWSDRESAVACAGASFHGYTPERLDLEFLITNLLPELERNGLWVSTNPKAQMTGIDVPPGRLIEEINRKLAEPAAGGNAE